MGLPVCLTAELFQVWYRQEVVEQVVVLTHKVAVLTVLLYMVVVLIHAWESWVIVVLCAFWP